MAGEDWKSLVTENLDLARVITAKRSRWRGGLFDDCLSAAYEGLVQAARSYDPGDGPVTRGRFRCFASARIHGAISDYMRTIGPASSNRYAQAKLKSVGMEPEVISAVPLDFAKEVAVEPNVEPFEVHTDLMILVRKAALDDRQMEILQDHLRDAPMFITARRLRISGARVSQLMLGALVSLRASAREAL